MTFAARTQSSRLPALEEAVGESRGECVACADLVDDRRRPLRRDLDAVEDRPARADSHDRAHRRVSEEMHLALAAEVPVDVGQHVELPRRRGLGCIRECGPEVRVEDDNRASPPCAPGDLEHELPGAVGDRHRDPGQMDETHAVEGLVRDVADAEPAGSGAGPAVRDLGAPAVA